MHLNLSTCNFHGQIASEISHLSKLALLDLSQYSEDYIISIPDTSYYDIISYPNTRFGQRDFSMLVHNLTHLSVLCLSAVDISSEVPTNLSTSLSNLQLNRSGVCASVASLPLLSKLRIAQNSLSGPVPSNFSGLQKLDVVYSYNSLNGTTPSWVFRHPSLRVLRLSHNQFTGQIDELEENSSLELIFLNNNQLHGPIPGSISKLLNLVWLDLSSNHLTGIVELNMFSNLENFRMLYPSDNRLAWRIVNDVNLSLPNLIYLGLSSCGLKEVPEFFRNSKSLSTLELSNNTIRQLPSWFTSTSSWEILNYLNFKSNQLKGP
ncbi:hypothetical protein ACH5RR_009522 [Cinchona calisaya]|uniref:Uncharacterized protein n=1 Tax=Cinchona calisaya TaxID=153742 RepID=A0ABD3AHI3_9GENT